VAEAVVRALSARADEGEARFRALAELSPDALLVNAGDSVVFANAAAARLLGFDEPQQVIGADPLEFVPPEYRDFARQRIARALEHGPTPVAEYPWLRRDGSLVWVEAAGARTVWGGRPAAQVVARDVTARRRAEEELRQNRETLRAVLENSLDAAYRRDLRTDSYEYVAPRIEDIVGFPPALLTGLSNDDALARIHPDDRGRVIDSMRHGTVHGMGRVEYRFLHADGCYRWLSDHFSIQPDADGLPAFRTGVVRDVTERKLAEAAVREGRARIDRQNAVLQGIARIFGEALASHSEEDVGRACLGVACRATGSDIGVLRVAVPEAPSPVTITHCGVQPRSRAGDGGADLDATVVTALERLCDNVLHSGVALIVNATVAPRGAPPVTSFLGVPLLHGGRAMGVIAVANRAGAYAAAEQDLVQSLAPAIVQALSSTRAEQALRQAKDSAERASRVKGQFLSTMSHELRTPLTAVIGLADLMESDVAGPTTPRQKEYLGRIRSSAWHLASIIDEILNFTRAAAGKESVRLADVDVADIARSVVATLTSEAERRSLALRLAGADDCVPILADGGKLRQILINLVGNAIRFTDSGSVDVELDAGTTGIEVHVRDTGPGIPADRMDEMFEPFVQGDQSATRNCGGTGLGLTVARRLARLMGGDVVAASTPGTGSTFTLRLPCQGPFSIVARSSGDERHRHEPDDRAEVRDEAEQPDNEAEHEGKGDAEEQQHDGRRDADDDHGERLADEPPAQCVAELAEQLAHALAVVQRRERDDAVGVEPRVRRAEQPDEDGDERVRRHIREPGHGREPGGHAVPRGAGGQAARPAAAARVACGRTACRARLDAAVALHLLDQPLPPAMLPQPRLYVGDEPGQHPAELLRLGGDLRAEQPAGAAQQREDQQHDDGQRPAVGERRAVGDGVGERRQHHGDEHAGERGQQHADADHGHGGDGRRERDQAEDRGDAAHERVAGRRRAGRRVYGWLAGARRMPAPSAACSAAVGGRCEVVASSAHLVLHHPQGRFTRKAQSPT
jgi:PAS domain S-box-containing protein